MVRSVFMLIRLAPCLLSIMIIIEFEWWMSTILFLLLLEAVKLPTMVMVSQRSPPDWPHPKMRKETQWEISSFRITIIDEYVELILRGSLQRMEDPDPLVSRKELSLRIAQLKNRTACGSTRWGVCISVM
jgi:hypothetical protein